MRRLNMTLIGLTALVALSLSTSAVWAGISISGVESALGVETVLAPGDVRPGMVEGDNPILFAEVLGGTIGTPGGVPVDHNGSQIIGSPVIGGSLNPALQPGNVSEGTFYSSYMFHFDPVGEPGSSEHFVSVVSFSHEVVGVQLFSDGVALDNPVGFVGSLEGGDAAVGGISGITYPSSDPSRGADELILTIDGRDIMLAGTGSGADIDQIRIFTLASGAPEPGAMVVWLAVMGCCGLVLNNRNRS